jgi:hypothetical protein
VSFHELLGWRTELPAVREAMAILGEPGSRWAVPTPALVLDIDAFDRNVALMAARTHAAGLTLRPHAKSHKSAVLARRQLDAGAAGVCCAKLGEAEALVAGGIGAVLVTSPVVDPALVRRLGTLAARADQLWLAADSADAVAPPAPAPRRSGSSSMSTSASVVPASPTRRPPPASPAWSPRPTACISPACRATAGRGSTWSGATSAAAGWSAA